MDKTVIQQNILNLVRYSKNIIYYVYMDTNKKKEKTLIGHKLCTINSHYTCTFMCARACRACTQHARAHILYIYIYMLYVYVHVAALASLSACCTAWSSASSSRRELIRLSGMANLISQPPLCQGAFHVFPWLRTRAGQRSVKLSAKRASEGYDP